MVGKVAVAPFQKSVDLVDDALGAYAKFLEILAAAVVGLCKSKYRIRK